MTIFFLIFGLKLLKRETTLVLFYKNKSNLIFVAKGSFDVSVPLSSLYTYMFAGLCASLAGVASPAGDADSSRAPGLTSGSWTEPGVLACTLQFTVILKNLAKCLWRWEPDRRNNFFGPPAHLCRHM